MFTETLLHPLAPAPASAPENFTYPFHYAPHPLAIAAAANLRNYLTRQTDWAYDFGLANPDEPGGQGKMFGVLVVADDAGTMGYLAAYSGKLAESNHLPGFVPPVFDILTDGGFYKAGEVELYALHAKIDALENDPRLAKAKQVYTQLQAEAETELAALKANRRAAKKVRNERRAVAMSLPETERAALEKELAKESVTNHFVVKDQTRIWKQKIAIAESRLNELQQKLDDLKAERSTFSNNLQRQIHEHYRFLNAHGERRDLLDIFEGTALRVPPAGAGECAAPKLLQYAYLNALQPIVMAEFWWGQSPASEIRKHGRYYPACRGKCLPILGHMLHGLRVDPNPMETNPATGKDLPVVYEDDDLLVVNKPPGFLSVPGKLINDSVQARMEARYPEARNHLIVHRLDMSTSGLLLLTKRKEVHRLVQQQFFKRSITKRYVALLEGDVRADEGYIDLPLRGDIEDRPRQLVDQEHGKAARTKWRVVERDLDGPRTRVHLWPVTGRTHQLRVHCAHPLGLNASIVGDDLYGVPGERLHLQAAELTFIHPRTDETLHFELPPEF